MFRSIELVATRRKVRGTYLFMAKVRCKCEAKRQISDQINSNIFIWPWMLLDAGVLKSASMITGRLLLIVHFYVQSFGF